MLSVAKHLAAQREILRGVSPERSEWAQYDKRPAIIPDLGR